MLGIYEKMGFSVQSQHFNLYEILGQMSTPDQLVLCDEIILFVCLELWLHLWGIRMLSVNGYLFRCLYLVKQSLR